MTERVSPRALLWACAAFAGGVLLHIDRMPPWAAGIALAFIAWRVATANSASLQPRAWVRVLLVLTMTGIVLARFHTLNGLSAGTTLLILMAALKLVETRRPRDAGVIAGSGLFLLLAACLDRQDMVRAPLYAIEAWLCCAALAAVASPELSARAAARLALRALLTAAPLALALFVFFPRLPGGFWAIQRSNEAVTGLSDSMTPGSITRLIASYDPAFRVKFAGAVPPREQLYWRGPVLHDFDGQTWRRAAWSQMPQQKLEYLGAPLTYQVALEPTRQHWWFGLDMPAHTDGAHVLLSYDYQLLSSEPVNEEVRYEATSYTATRATGPLSASARRQDTRLPAGANPRTLELAQQLRAAADTDRALVDAALDYLRRGGFVYSLTPESLGRDSVDDLLFHTHEGFCGHYASAFVDLMRAAGVPARVVTGYLGGEWNPIGKYLVVRQSDAHAWAEVWLEGRGWTRVDPTAVVAPERLRRGLLDLLPDAMSTRERLVLSSPWLLSLMQRWDAANSWWTGHVVHFEYTSQLDLLARLGIRAPDARYLGWAFMGALLSWLALLGWYMGRSARAAPADALARAYLRLCRKLARGAPARAAHQGPLDYLASVARARPDLQARAQPLLERYAQLRYGAPGAAHAQEVAQFLKAVARLTVPRDGVRAD